MPRFERDHSPVPVLVLAAGRGERMGGPKALMMVGGRAWWRVQMERLARAGVEATWVVSNEVRDRLMKEEGRPERLVLADSSAPMFESVMAGIESLRGAEPPGVFVLPVDVPAAGRGVWAALMAAREVGIPAWRGKGGHPVYLRWEWVESALIGSRRHWARAPELRLDLLIGPVAETIEVNDASVVVNLNTPGAVEEWSAAADGGGAGGGA